MSDPTRRAALVDVETRVAAAIHNAVHPGCHGTMNCTRKRSDWHRMARAAIAAMLGCAAAPADPTPSHPVPR